jgi:hypothetical protein
MKLRTAIVVVTCCLMVSIPLAQGGTKDSSYATKKALSTMNKMSTLGHPDLFFEFDAMGRYAKGDYSGAMRNFLQAAEYADKPSQLSIGLMYLNGQGVEKDPVKAYAWVALSAERNYPSFVATRSQIWGLLTPEQRQQAIKLQQSLDTEYGDAVTKPHEIQAMKNSMTDMLGGIPRYPTGMPVYTSLGSAMCDQGNVRECTDVYAKWFWDPKTYYTVRDAVWTGTVTVGALQNVSGAGKTNASGASSENTH